MFDEVHILLCDSTNICRYITSRKLKFGKEYKCSCKHIMSAQQSVIDYFIRKLLLLQVKINHTTSVNIRIVEPFRLPTLLELECDLHKSQTSWNSRHYSR